MTTQDQLFAKTIRSNALIKPSAGDKKDPEWYLELYNQIKQNKFIPVHSWNNLYLKLLLAMQNTVEDVNLTTITREEIYARDLPCISLVRVIEAGLLPKVKEYNRFENLI